MGLKCKITFSENVGERIKQICQNSSQQNLVLPASPKPTRHGDEYRVGELENVNSAHIWHPRRRKISRKTLKKGKNTPKKPFFASILIVFANRIF